MARRESLMKLALGVMVLVALVAGRALAEEGDEPAKKTTVTGKVVVDKDDAGTVTGVKVGAQKLVVDDKAKEVAKLADKQVEVTGTATDAGLKVESYKAVEEKKEDPAE